MGFLSLGWGLLADIDIESERLRVLGGARFTLWAAARVLTLRTYRGKIHYLEGSQEGRRTGDERRVERPRLERAITIGEMRRSGVGGEDVRWEVGEVIFFSSCEFGVWRI